MVQPNSSPETSPRAQEPITLPKVTRKESNSSALGSPRTKLGQPVRGPVPDASADPPPSRIGASVGKIQPQSSIGASVSRIKPQSSIGASVGRIEPPARGGTAPGAGRLNKRSSFDRALEADEEFSRDGGAASQGSRQPSRNTASLVSQFEQQEAPRRSRPNVLDELSQVSILFANKNIRLLLFVEKGCQVGILQKHIHSPMASCMRDSPVQAWFSKASPSLQGRKALVRDDSLGSETNPFVTRAPKQSSQRGGRRSFGEDAFADSDPPHDRCLPLPSFL